MQDVAALAREAEHVLQDIAGKIAEDIARLTQEIGATSSRVEGAFGDMDSQVESMGSSLQQLCDQHEEQMQHTQATLQTTAALEQWL